MRPSSLLEQQVETLPNLIEEAGIPAERIRALLQRSVALALSLEKWNRVGIWVVSRASTDYPQKLKKRLGVQAPPILYGCGNESLLDAGGLAIVGSRNAADADLSLAADLSRSAAKERIAVVSGGARGVDDTSMQAALAEGGFVIGVLSDSLQRHALSTKYRSALREGRAVLVSTVAPEARFNVGNAMARNKYIYCLAGAVVVIHSGRTGGTWNGAVEALRNRWVPVWVARSSDDEAANPLLVEKGATWLPSDVLFGTLTSLWKPNGGEGTEGFSTEEATEKVATILRDGPMRVAELQERLDLPLGRLRRILKQAVSDGLIIKRTRPVRYEATDRDRGKQLEMFEG